MKDRSDEYDKMRQDNESLTAQVADLQRKFEEEIKNHSTTTTKLNDLAKSSASDIIKLKKYSSALKDERTKLQEENKQIEVLKQELSRSEQNERERSEEVKNLRIKYDNDMKELTSTKNT